MPHSKISPAYRIETERLVLRCWDPADAPLAKSAIDMSLDHLRPWMPWAMHEPEELPAKVGRLRRFRGHFDLGIDFTYGVFSADESEALGGTGLHTRLGPDALEIGYWIRVDHIGQGLATELSAALTRVAFEIHRIRRVEIHCRPSNVRSAAVPRKLGYTHEATLRKRVQESDGSYGDTMVWTLLDDEYAGSPADSYPLAAFDAAGHKLL